MEIGARHDKIDEICSRFMAEMAEYADCAQLAISFIDQSGETHLAEKGYGNYYARVGMCQSFLKKDAARDGLEVEYSEYKGDGDEQ